MNTDLKPWQIEKEELYETFPIFSLKRSSRIHPTNGKRFDFFLMDGLDWVNSIVLTEDQRVVLVSQFRHGTNSVTVETPGGCVEHGEDPEQAARRELIEETGYEAAAMQRLGTLHPNPAMQSMRCHFFAGSGARLVAPQNLDISEDIRVFTAPVSDFRRMIRDGRISHAIVIAAYGLWTLAKNGQLPNSSGD